ncbi:MAG: hypothetical protein Sw2LagPseu_35410 [Shewanella algae]
MLAKHMCVYLGCFQIIVPQQLLDASDVSASLQQMSREGMPEGMACDPFRNT